jgi:hypothetical protein
MRLVGLYTVIVKDVLKKIAVSMFRMFADREGTVAPTV